MENNWKFAIRALKSRNYRLFFGGQAVSLIGTWLTTVATSWLVYRLAREDGADAGKSAFILGVVGFASQAPQLFMAPFAGAWVDRFNRHRVLLYTQGLSMVQSFLLAGLVLSHHASILGVICLNIFQGLVNAFDIPARQALTIDLVEKREDLPNAIALSSSMVHAARLIGPALAGFLIYHFGEGSCFLIDGFSFLAVLLALLKMNLKPYAPPEISKSLLTEVKEGFSYSWNSHPIRYLLLFVASTSLLTTSQQVLLPIISQHILGGGERIYGFLLCFSGFGALLGALYLAGRKTVIGLGGIITWANFVLGIGFLALALSTGFWASALSLTVTGCALIVQVASINSILQTIVEDSKRGRVMGLFALAFMGIMPLGSFLSGSIAQHLGIPWTLAISGLGCVITSLLFLKILPTFRIHVRPIYVKLGLLAAVVETPH
jgi:MFS family permease